MGIEPMKNWTELSSSDFECADPEWSGRPSAKVEFQGLELDIDLPNDCYANDRAVSIAKTMLATWIEKGKVFARMTENLVQPFLPGRKVVPNDLELWQIALVDCDDSLSAIVYRYCLKGDYSDPSFDLSQFDGNSTVEIQYPLDGDKPDWRKPYINSTNDFD